MTIISKILYIQNLILYNAYCGNNPIINIDPSGNTWYHWVIGGAAVAAVIIFSGGSTAPIIIGAALGFAQSYMHDVVKNAQDGFDFSDLITINNENWVEQSSKYFLSTSLGAMTGYIGGTGLNVFSKGLFIGASNTVIELVIGEISTSNELGASLLRHVFISTVTCGLLKNASKINPKYVERSIPTVFK